MMRVSARGVTPLLGILFIQFLLLSKNVALATVVVQIDSFTFDALSDMPASFGPKIPNEGLSGLLVVAEPSSACSPLQVPQFVSQISQPWIALISRSQGEDEECTFDVKVRYAQDAGAAAAIVYDDIYENLIIMAKPSSNPDPLIPSVFVSQKSGLLLQKLYAPGYTQVYISNMSDMVWMSMIISTLAGFFAVSVVVTAFYLARRPSSGDEEEGEEEEEVAGTTRPRRRQGMNAEQLKLLPVIVHKAEDANEDNSNNSRNSGGGALAPASAAANPGEWHTAGDTKRVCAICLELYEPDDKLRLLPCQHRYHKECIDPWLTTRKPLCPVCKFDANTTTAPQQLEGADVEAGEGSSGGGTSTNSTRRSGGGMFSEEGARENIRRAAQRVLESRLLSWVRPNNSPEGNTTSSGEDARMRLLPLAESSQRTVLENSSSSAIVPAAAAAVVVEAGQQEPV